MFIKNIELRRRKTFDAVFIRRCIAGTNEIALFCIALTEESKTGGLVMITYFHEYLDSYDQMTVI